MRHGRHCALRRCIKAARGRADGNYLPSVYWLGNALEFVFTQIGEFKDVAHQATSRRGNDDLIGGGQAL